MQHYARSSRTFKAEEFSTVWLAHVTVMIPIILWSTLHRQRLGLLLQRRIVTLFRAKQMVTCHKDFILAAFRSLVSSKQTRHLQIFVPQDRCLTSLALSHHVASVPSACNTPIFTWFTVLTTVSDTTSSFKLQDLLLQ